MRLNTLLTPLFAMSFISATVFAQPTERERFEVMRDLEADMKALHERSNAPVDQEVAMSLLNSFRMSDPSAKLTVEEIRLQPIKKKIREQLIEQYLQKRIKAGDSTARSLLAYYHHPVGPDFSAFTMDLAKKSKEEARKEMDKFLAGRHGLHSSMIEWIMEYNMKEPFKNFYETQLLYSKRGDGHWAFYHKFEELPPGSYRSARLAYQLRYPKCEWGLLDYNITPQDERETRYSSIYKYFRKPEDRENAMRFNAGSDDLLSRLFVLQNYSSPDGKPYPYSLKKDIARVSRMAKKGKYLPSSYAQGQVSPKALYCLAGDMYVQEGRLQNDSLKGIPFYNNAVSAYQQAIANGNPYAHQRLGLLYLQGPAYIRDEKKAMAHLRAAGEAGFGRAWYQLGEMFEFGQGIPIDKDSAGAAYKKAVQAGVYAYGYTGIKRVKPSWLTNVFPPIVTVSNEQVKEIMQKDASPIKVFHHVPPRRTENIQGYLISIALQQWLNGSTLEGTSLYIGAINYLPDMEIIGGLGHTGVVFNIIHKGEFKNASIYLASLRDSTLSELAMHAHEYSVCNPEFDERWNTTLPVTFVYVKGEAVPYYFGPNSSFKKIYDFITEKRKYFGLRPSENR